MAGRVLNTPPPTPPAADPVRFSVVVPLRDEAGNIDRLLERTPSALDGIDRVGTWEIILVDDGSTDDTWSRIARAADADGAGRIRAVRLRGPHGKESALAAGIDAARYEVIGLLDGDLQTLPEDFAVLFEAYGGDVACVNGARVDRHDSTVKRWSSRIANRVRGAVLGDGFHDVNCPLKIVRRDVLLRLPRFRAWHRYVPALVLREGWQVREVPIRHQERVAGRSKYGVWNRLWIGIASLAVVAWLMRNRVGYATGDTRNEPTGDGVR